MKNLDKYFNRVLPVIGRELQNKIIVFFNLDQTHLIVDAFARCGVKKMIFIDSRIVKAESAFVLSYGVKYVGQNIGKAMSDVICNHNKLIKDWQHILIEKSNIEEAISNNDINLLVGAGDVKEGISILIKSHSNQIPAIFFVVLEGLPISSVVFIKHPELPDVSNTILKINKYNVLSSIDLKHRITWLEASDLVMNFAKGLLLRGSKYQRNDLEKIFFKQKKNVVLRGQTEWPWWIHYINPEEKLNYLEQIFKTKFFIPQLPINILKDSKVMLIGCGTGSLVASELVNYFKQILFVDYKSFSIYNPVRQLLGTDYIGQPKPLALINYLQSKLGFDPVDHVKHSNTTNDEHNLDELLLKITEGDEKSVQTFESLLTSFNPDLVIVATGRTYDDNYTICEILRKRGIKHIIPSAFPCATHYKTIVVDGHNGPCYECIRGNTNVDYSDAVQLNSESREMFYSDSDDPTQPATIFETWPSSHNFLRLCLEILVIPELRSSWFEQCITHDQACFVGGNIADKIDDGYAYGVAFPGQVVVYGMQDLIRVDENEYICPTCKKSYQVVHTIKT
ncbi:ThiF family adenylyltransferase [Patescibacteria group bacterium]